MSQLHESITRRAALARVAQLMGGAISAPTLAGVLAGCASGAALGADGWRPRTLTAQQAEMVLVIGEHLIPETDTPGARTARVDRFVDAMLSDYYTERPRRAFLDGLARVDEHSRRLFGAAYLRAEPDQQLQLTRALNREAFRTAPPPPPAGLPNPEPELRERNADRELEHTLPAPDGPWHPDDVGRGAFFRNLKELVLIGFYTSEPGATEELRVNPMGIWRGDVPYSEIGQAWS